MILEKHLFLHKKMYKCIITVLLCSFSVVIAAQNSRTRPSRDSIGPLIDSAFYMVVEDDFMISGVGLAVIGKVSTGSVSAG